MMKRYRYTGKERDEESGFYYHGARYYAPWLGRWLATDPLESKYAGLSPYNYGFNNPVKWTDSTGMEPDNEVQVGFNSGKGTEQQPVGMNGVVVSAKKITTSSAEKQEAFSIGMERAQALSIRIPEARQDKMRTVSGREYQGHNWWHDVKQSSSLASTVSGMPDPIALIDELLNPAARVVQQLMHGLTGQQIVRNLDGTKAWHADYPSASEKDQMVMDVGITGLNIATFGYGTAEAAAVEQTTVRAVEARGQSLVAESSISLQGGRAAKGVKSTPSFIVSEGGTVFPVPKGATGPIPATSGKGFQFIEGVGGNGLSPKATGFRFMDPVTTGKYQYPGGYGSYFNKAGQTINPFTGQTISPSNQWWHIPAK